MSFTHHHLTELIHAKWDGKEPLKLYIYGKDGFHRGGIWFRDKPKYPDEEIVTSQAMQRVADAMTDKREIRICDGGDFLVFHAVRGKVIYDGMKAV